MDYTVLIAEDDDDIVELLKLYLENEKLHVLTASNGKDALALIETTKVDLAVLDIMMPKMNGYEVTKQIRMKSNMPILILSAKSQDNDKILGLDLGADDYLAKPFNPLEVVARIKSLLRRTYEFAKESSRQDHNHTIMIGELSLNTESFELEKNGVKIMLTSTEYKILAILMKSPGRVYTKSQISEIIKGDYYQNDDNTIMVHISNLRDKIELDAKNPTYIKTIRGLGYKIEKI
ncbi:MAG: response regulator transcription factor [Turicibacter sp.]